MKTGSRSCEILSHFEVLTVTVEKPSKTAMNRGILKQDDDFEEYANIVVEHFFTKEGFMNSISN